MHQRRYVMPAHRNDCGEMDFVELHLPSVTSGGCVSMVKNMHIEKCSQHLWYLRTTFSKVVLSQSVFECISDDPWCLRTETTVARRALGSCAFQVWILTAFDWSPATCSAPAVKKKHISPQRGAFSFLHSRVVLSRGTIVFKMWTPGTCIAIIKTVCFDKCSQQLWYLRTKNSKVIRLLCVFGCISDDMRSRRTEMIVARRTLWSCIFQVWLPEPRYHCKNCVFWKMCTATVIPAHNIF